jgi:hypothetical protein
MHLFPEAPRRRRGRQLKDRGEGRCTCVYVCVCVFVRVPGASCRLILIFFPMLILGWEEEAERMQIQALELVETNRWEAERM